MYLRELVRVGVRVAIGVRRQSTTCIDSILSEQGVENITQVRSAKGTIALEIGNVTVFTPHGEMENSSIIPDQIENLPIMIKWSSNGMPVVTTKWQVVNRSDVE